MKRESMRKWYAKKRIPDIQGRAIRGNMASIEIVAGFLRKARLLCPGLGAAFAGNGWPF
jgi:hypothetical protein